jgi:hypothetical protein
VTSPSEGNSSTTVINGNVDRLLQIRSVEGDVNFFDDDLIAKLSTAIAAQQKVDTGDRRTRTAVAKALSLLRAKRALYTDLDHEVWAGVFPALRELRDTLAEASAELTVDGPDSVNSLVILMTTSVRNYLSRWEGDYYSHIAAVGGGADWTQPNYNWHDQFSWERRLDAARDMIVLRELLVGAVQPLNSYARTGEAPIDWPAESVFRQYELQPGHRDS